MQKIVASVLVSGILAAAAPAHAGLAMMQQAPPERVTSVQMAGYWGYANCVAGKRAWQGMHGMLGLSMLSPVMIGTAVSCFEAF
jgi:hypothetical protein